MDTSLQTLDKSQITEAFKLLQDSICHQLESADRGGKFREDIWERPLGGGGRSRVIEGQIIEKGGVNFSAVEGEMADEIANKLEMRGGEFYATGVSIVLHPISPLVPIIHMNVRYFEMREYNAPKGQTIWWFGGGIDLTPHYIDDADAQYFHAQLKKVCDSHHPDYYAQHKTWADNYFYLPHRQETRGVGGIFFDRLSTQNGFSKAQQFQYVMEVGHAFAPIYTYFMRKNHALPYSEQEKKWQLLRRGRYVEFNLVWDRGTKFGLQTEGRTESILMSMPPQANWIYDYQPAEGSKEAITLSKLKKGINWLEKQTSPVD